MKTSISAPRRAGQGKSRAHSKIIGEKVNKRRAWFGDWNEAVLLWEQKGKPTSISPSSGKLNHSKKDLMTLLALQLNSSL